MTTVLQENLAKAIVKNSRRKKPYNKGQLLASVGYSAKVAKHKPQEILEQKGVLDALEEYGFDPDSAKRVVKEILNKDTARDDVKLRAADMIFEVHGTYAPVKSVNINVDVKPSDALKKLAHGLLESQRHGLDSSIGVVPESVGSATEDKERGGELDRVREETLPS